MITETYIKMSSEAWPDLEPLLSDKPDTLICDGYNVGLVIPDGLDNEWPDEEDSFTFHIMYKIKEPFETEDFKIPRQEDLQKICKKSDVKIGVHRLSDWFREKMYFELLGEEGNWDILWMHYTMEKVYNKTWNGRTWETIT